MYLKLGGKQIKIKFIFLHSLMMLLCLGMIDHITCRVCFVLLFVIRCVIYISKKLNKYHFYFLAWKKKKRSRENTS